MTNKDIIDKAVEYIDSRRNIGLTVEDVALNAGFCDAIFLCILQKGLTKQRILCYHIHDEYIHDE